MDHGTAKSVFLPSRDYRYVHAMAKNLEFPSRALNNKGIKVTRWHDTGFMPSRVECPNHAMEKIEVLPSRALHIGDT
ncbi:hypothetical protein BHAP_1497 [Bifidobacterium hapali]|uniref:Uncharacterized protein n=1 Tax=Bifidobacterium hapali TaxID=1630172 RepID=A0A261FXS1_9BIFI|nr:hypothetical protein BHAP_1497 [Bifidobacterium hapali]